MTADLKASALCINCAKDGKCMKRQAMCLANGTASQAPAEGDALDDVQIAHLFNQVPGHKMLTPLATFTAGVRAAQANVQPKGMPTDEQWRASKYGQEAAKLADDYLNLMTENAGLREQLAEVQAPAPAPEHVPVSPEHEAAIDAAVGLVLLPPIRVTAEVYAELKAASDASGRIVQAVVRDRLSQAPAVGDAEAQS